jgi:hypothetical protein
MFDPDVEYGSAWQLRLQDAILDKCGPTAHIQHIAVAVDKVNRYYTSMKMIKKELHSK